MADRDHASVRDLANLVFELNRRVEDVELVGEALIEPLQDRLTFRGAQVGDANMAGERMSFAANTPHMQVMHVDDALDRLHSLRHPIEFDTARGAFQQDIEALADHAKR